MTISITSPVQGAVLTGFTAPTYTLVSDQAPEANGKQYAVSALGGTQAGVTISSASDPFTITFVKPKVIKLLGAPDPSTGRLPSVPMNTWLIITRKGVLPLANQPRKAAVIRTFIDVPAGSDIADVANLKGMWSFYTGIFGALANDQSIFDSMITNTL